ncbi:NAD(P)-dependent oxidoreductase [Amycolatopsis rhabdoformis]|uniref:NAD(P)-dependent oxidoreductase n=1 Tax=Amycolatopsis rhabdoformis TaxID=1448059 RepID=A0ABZ1IAP6_9PSEU|nr:NAD(P)-dependent oxidoreductase [Amycolatopsis rhabdoformis]WSE31530.1 NAD(P)-dependent oxidoreductase [Amycolatopsis rhabdoformis]
MYPGGPRASETGDKTLSIGFIGLGDQGAPLATAIAEAGFPLHVWARRPASLDAVAGVAHTAHDSVAGLAAAVDVLALCVSEDEDVLDLLTDGLAAALRPGTVVVNHGTGVPSAAARMAALCAAHDVGFLDAPVSGGHAGAVSRTLTTMVGGPAALAERCTPVFEAFSAHVHHLGDVGSGQLAKLFNNTLMMMNQANLEEVLAVAASLEVDLASLVAVLKNGSAGSFTLSALGEAITAENVEHLSKVELLDMDLFAAAMAERGAPADAVTARAVAGAEGLVELMKTLTK